MARVTPLFSNPYEQMKKFIDENAALKLKGLFDDRAAAEIRTAPKFPDPIITRMSIDKDIAEIIRKNEDLFSNKVGTKIDQNIEWLDPV